jgi:cation diffusion facilitator CzcD-associated flavoprotein CzcO
MTPPAILGYGSPAPQQPQILIIGAGITGLTLGQALKKHSIPFTLFERDPTVLYRGRGWGRKSYIPRIINPFENIKEI